MGKSPSPSTGLVKLIVVAGLSGAVMNLVTCSGLDMGRFLVSTHPRVGVVNSTGYRDAGDGDLRRAGVKGVGLALGGDASTVFEDVSPEMGIAMGGGFGPAVPDIKVGSSWPAIEIANNAEHGLSSSICTNDVETAVHTIEKLEAWITYGNALTIGAWPQLSPDGVKQTGNRVGVDGTHWNVGFAEVKTIYFDYSGSPQRPIDTYSG